MELTRETFQSSIIAQDDDCDYSESGYVAIVIGDKAAIGSYSHCSCFGTCTALGIPSQSRDEDYNPLPGTPAPVSFAWEGSIKELVALAARRGCLTFPDREAHPNDYDYDHLMTVYHQIECWAKEHTYTYKHEGD